VLHCRSQTGNSNISGTVSLWHCNRRRLIFSNESGIVDHGQLEDSVHKRLQWRRPTVGNGNMAAKTGNGNPTVPTYAIKCLTVKVLPKWRMRCAPIWLSKPIHCNTWNWKVFQTLFVVLSEIWIFPVLLCYMISYNFWLLCFLLYIYVHLACM